MCVGYGPPIRRDGSKEFAFIPAEIYISIFDHIPPGSHQFSRTECREIFASLSLVCWFFCLECQPRLFRSLQYDGHAIRRLRPTKLLSTEDTDGSRLTILRGFAREFSMLCGYVEDSLFLARLAEFRHLRSLNLHHCDISSSTMDALAQMANLETASFLSCCVTAPDSPNKPWPIRRWKSLAEDHVGGPGVERAWFTSSIMQLTDIEHVRILRISK